VAAEQAYSFPSMVMMRIAAIFALFTGSNRKNLSRCARILVKLRKGPVPLQTYITLDRD
jgi:hypothetical protein